MHQTQRMTMTARLLAVVVAVAIGLLWRDLAAVQAARPITAESDGQPAVYFPDVQAKPKTTPSRYQVVPLGQEGFGESVIEVQSRTDRGAALALTLSPRSTTSGTVLERSLGPRGAVRIETVGEAAIQGGMFSAQLAGDQPVGAIARLGWSTGARAAYEAAAPATEMILPLITRSVYGHYSVATILNPDTSHPRNEVDLRIYDNSTGELVKVVTANIPAGASTFYDTNVDDRLFGPGVVGTNAPTGGWLGTVWLVAQRPAVALVYGDETSGDGTMAYVGRPVSSASLAQYLPLVRSGYHGSTLIAVANATDQSVEVTIEYRGAPYSPVGAGEAFFQTFSISPRGSRFVDLSTRGRSTVPQPPLPPAAKDGGFVGSAVIRANGPVLAVAQDERVMGGKVQALAAYNAMGPDDLGTAFGVPGWRNAADNLTTTLVIQNPTAGEVAARVRIMTLDDRPVTELQRRVPAGSMTGVSLAGLAGVVAGADYRALIDTDGPVAALVVEEPGRAAHLASPGAGPASHSRMWSDTMIAAAVRLEPTGPAATPTPGPLEPTATAVASPTPPYAATATPTAPPPTAAPPTATMAPRPSPLFLPLAYAGQRAGRADPASGWQHGYAEAGAQHPTVR